MTSAKVVLLAAKSMDAFPSNESDMLSYMREFVIESKDVDGFTPVYDSSVQYFYNHNTVEVIFYTSGTERDLIDWIDRKIPDLHDFLIERDILGVKIFRSNSES